MMTQQARHAPRGGPTMESLHWRDAGSYHLPQSQSTLTIPQPYKILLDNDARHLPDHY